MSTSKTTDNDENAPLHDVQWKRFLNYVQARFRETDLFNASEGEIAEACLTTIPFVKQLDAKWMLERPADFDFTVSHNNFTFRKISGRAGAVKEPSPNP